MPDHGERPAEEIERKLEQELESPPYSHLPSPDYGSLLLDASQPQHLSGGRKVNGGIMLLPNYKGPTVNIRVPKWLDNSFWIKAEDFEAAQYIADAVFHHTGRRPFHFPDANFRYPPLCLGTGELLNTRDKCLAHVAKIAKGSALRSERGDYKERVKKLVLEAVKSSEAVQFLKRVREIPRQVPHFDASQCGNLVLQANIEEETHSTVIDDGEEEQGTPMEVDTLSEEAIQSLTPIATVDPACMFHVSSSVTSLGMDLDISTAYVASFGMELDEYENILHVEGQRIGMGHKLFFEKKKAGPAPSNLKGFLDSLDEDEEEIGKFIEPSDWEQFSPRPIISYHCC